MLWFNVEKLPGAGDADTDSTGFCVAGGGWTVGGGAGAVGGGVVGGGLVG